MYISCSIFDIVIGYITTIVKGTIDMELVVFLLQRELKNNIYIYINIYVEVLCRSMDSITIKNQLLFRYNICNWIYIKESSNFIE